MIALFTRIKGWLLRKCHCDCHKQTESSTGLAASNATSWHIRA